eukprot:g13853.t1
MIVFQFLAPPPAVCSSAATRRQQMGEGRDFAFTSPGGRTDLNATSASFLQQEETRSRTRTDGFDFDRRDNPPASGKNRRSLQISWLNDFISGTTGWFKESARSWSDAVKQRMQNAAAHVQESLEVIQFLPDRIATAWGNEELVTTMIELFGHLEAVITANEWDGTQDQWNRPWPLYRQLQCLHADEDIRDSAVEPETKNALLSKSRIVELQRFSIYAHAAYHLGGQLTPTPTEYESGVRAGFQDAWGTEGLQKLAINAVSQPVSGSTLLGHEVLWYVATDNELQEVVLGVRGTASIDDVWKDLNTDPVEVNARERFGTNFNSDVYSNTDVISVHGGIYNAMVVVEGAALPKVEEVMQDKLTGGWRLVITGHSLGAAVASLIFAHWTGTDKLARVAQSRDHVYCYTYGTPGVLPKDSVRFDPTQYVAVIAADDAVPRVSNPAFVANQVAAATQAIALAVQASPALAQDCYSHSKSEACRDTWKTVQDAVWALKTAADATDTAKWLIPGKGVVYLSMNQAEREEESCLSGQTRPTELEQKPLYVVAPMLADEIFWTLDPVVLWFNPTYLLTETKGMLSLNMLDSHKMMSSYRQRLLHAKNTYEDWAPPTTSTTTTTMMAIIGDAAGTVHVVSGSLTFLLEVSSASASAHALAADAALKSSIVQALENALGGTAASLTGTTLGFQSVTFVDRRLEQVQTVSRGLILLEEMWGESNNVNGRRRLSVSTNRTAEITIVFSLMAMAQAAADMVALLAQRDAFATQFSGHLTSALAQSGASTAYSVPLPTAAGSGSTSAAAGSTSMDMVASGVTSTNPFTGVTTGSCNSGDDDDNTTLLVVAGIFGGVGVIVAALAVGLLCYNSSRRREEVRQAGAGAGGQLGGPPTPSYPAYGEKKGQPGFPEKGGKGGGKGRASGKGSSLPPSARKSIRGDGRAGESSPEVQVRESRKKTPRGGGNEAKTPRGGGNESKAPRGGGNEPKTPRGSQRTSRRKE